MSDLENMTAAELDEFAAWAHAIERTPGVTVIEGDPHEIMDTDAAHGSNSEDETAVDG